MQDLYMITRFIPISTCLWPLFLLLGCGRVGFDSTGAVAATAECAPMPTAKGGTVVVGPNDVSTLVSLLADAPRGTTILLESGSYDLSDLSELTVTAPGITLRSQDGDPSSVVLTTSEPTASFVKVYASDVTIAEISIENLGLRIVPLNAISPPPLRTFVYRVDIADSTNHGVFIGDAGTDRYPDYGTVACSSFRLTDAGRQQLQPGRFAGIRGAGIQGWQIYANTFEGFHSPDIQGRGLQIDRGSRDTIIENNSFRDCEIGIMLGDDVTNGRVHNDQPCGKSGYWEFVNGIVRNNTVLSTTVLPRIDANIALWSACGTRVVHNTLVSLEQPAASIEWRYPETDILVKNNLASHSFRVRQGGTAEEQGNIESVELDVFVDPSAADFRLTVDSPGVPLEAEEADIDMDRNPRDLQTPDVGAYEFVP